MVKTPPPQSFDDLTPDLRAYMEIEREISKSHTTWHYLGQKFAIPAMAIGTPLGVIPDQSLYFRPVGLFLFVWGFSLLIERQNLRRLELVYQVLRGLRQQAQVKPEATLDISDRDS